MKIPKKLKIGGKTYKIVLRDRYKEDGTTNSGSHYAWPQKIWIDNTQHIEGQESALIHEIIEAINNENDLQLTHQQISVLEASFYQVLKDNKLLK